MIYWLLFGALAVWVFADGLKRRAKPVLWSVGTLLLGPIVLPVYLAKRPLKSGEVREGGTAWNVLKNFALFWTLLMALAAISSMVAVSEHTTRLQSDAEFAGAAIGAALGFGFLAMLWFFPMVGALILGFFLKKSSVVERGPTGPLVPSEASRD